MDHVQLRLLTSGCGCWRLPARSTVASPAVLFFSRLRRSEEAAKSSVWHMSELGWQAHRSRTSGAQQAGLLTKCLLPAITYLYV